MPRRWRLHLVAAFALLGLIAAPPSSAAPRDFLYMSAGDVERALPLLERDDVHGAQIVYNWRMLEPRRGEYDFSGIERDLARMEALSKPLFIQLQDRFFRVSARNLPDYLLTGPEFDGGLAPQFEGRRRGTPKGWVAKQWNAAVRARFQALLTALAERFDGRLAGINLPETAMEIDERSEPGFTCDGYFEATRENAAHARRVFERSHVVQYVNFWPCEWPGSER